MPVASCGFLGWLGFVVAGSRTKERRYWIAAAVFGLCVAVGFALIAIDNERDTILSDLGVIPVLVSMLGGAVVAGIWNRDYLVKLAEGQVWGSDASALPPAPPVAQEGFLGVNRTEFYGRTDGATGTPPEAHQTYQTPWVPSYPSQKAPPVAPSLNINTASAEQLVAQLAVSSDVAARVIQGREARGQYASLDDVVAVAGLQPHELVRFRNRVTFGARQDPHPPPSQPSGRVLDF